jgi:hypothetical protein
VRKCGFRLRMRGEVYTMFESLDDHIKHDTETESTRTQRVLQWVMALVAGILVFGGLYYGVRLLD